VFAAVEELQGAGQGCIDVEHMLSWTVSRASQLVPLPPQQRPASVLLACAEREAHSLPLEALRAALCERGVAVVMLGSAVPVSALPTATSVWTPTTRPFSRTLSTRASAVTNVYGPASSGRSRKASTWTPELLHHGADLRFRQRRDAQGIDEFLPPSGRDPDQTTRRDHGGQGPLGPLPALQQPIREVGALPQFGDGDVEGADSGIEVPVPETDQGC
jgi:hypothetical protein